MSKIIFMILLLSLTTSKEIQGPQNLEYGVATTFDKQNNEFTFKYNGERGDYLGVNIEYSSYFLTYVHTSEIHLSHSITVHKPGIGNLFPLYISGDQQNITLYYSKEPESDVEGKIWINPLKNELDVDLTKNYSLKVPLNSQFTQIEELSPLTYVIKKASKTVNFIFEYEEKVQIGIIDEITVPNPFEVCDEDDNCQENVKKEFILFMFDKSPLSKTFKIY